MFHREPASIAYRLEGEALEAARDIHEYSKFVEEEYEGISLEIQRRTIELEQEISKLRYDFEIQHAEKFTAMFQQLGKSLNLSIQELKLFHLDVAYLDDHNIAFLKQSRTANPLMSGLEGSA